jgi:vacuolar protein sorting-associated protein 41
MDCIISGISLYTQTLLLALAYTTPDDDDEDESEEEDKTPSPPQRKQAGKQPTEPIPKGHKSKQSSASAASRTSSEPAGGIRKRQNNLPPELRLIDLTSQSEVSKDGLSVSRYERLGAADYHLGLLPAQTASAAVASRGAFEALAGFGEGIWSGVVNPGRIFGSGSGAVAGSSASVRSQESGDVGSGSRAGGNGSGRFQRGASLPTVDPALAKPGVKIFIHSPYDCILATKRDLADHLGWLMEREMYQAAWELVDEHPEIVTSQPAQRSGQSEGSGTPDRAQRSHTGADDFYDDSVSQSDSAAPNPYSNAEKEKRRIGELWIQDLVEAQQWRRAGQVAGKVLSSADRWEKWVWTFAGAGKFDEIADYMPTEVMKPPIKGTVYEVVLGHYLQSDKVRFRALLERWGTDLFDISAVVTALENQLNFRDVREDTVEGGEKGRDWRIVLESLARLQEANGRNREALRHYIRLQDADSAMRLIKERHLADAVADDIPSFIALRVPAGQADRMERKEVEEATAEAVSLLVDEAQHGLVKPAIVVEQLQGQHLDLYTFFYLRGLLHGEGLEAHHPDEMKARLLLESRSLVDDFADLAVRLFAKYERDLLMDFFEGSTSYSFEKAVAECEHHGYVPELVYLYSKTGQTKRALYLVIDRLGDVNRAIGFAREQDDAELWEDLLEYSMDKPRFIHGLLEGIGVGSAAGEGGATIDPVKLVRRIPEGLQVEGLREGLRHLLREHEVQMSISGGAARVVRGEVAAKQALLRAGQRKGIRFEVMQRQTGHLDVKAGDVPTTLGVINGKAALVGGIGSNAAAAAAPSTTMVVTSGGHGTTVQPAAPTKFASDPPPPNSQTNGSTNGVHKSWKPGHCAACLEPFTEDEEETLVGFACGHVFHLSHLLKMLHPDDPEMQDTSFLAIGEGAPTGRRMRVGLKVTHARLLKERVEGGCPVDGRGVDQ